MNRRYLMTLDDFKLICKGAIGSLSFGAYHMYYTTNMINENNRNNDYKLNENNRNNDYRLNEYEKKINELSNKIDRLEKKRWFF